MRIISGICRGKTLFSLKGMTTRPTADRVRESIFNIISGNLPDARVLDLFAGSGAMGLEALSRGAQSAVFVESSPAAGGVILKNIRACRMAEKSRLLRWDITRNLNCLNSSEPAFDLVFMDPPYGKGCIRPALEHLLGRGVLADHSLIVIEHAAAEPVPEALGPATLTDQRVYGKTLVSFLAVVLQNASSVAHFA